MSVRLVLAKGREKSLLRRHPWVFSGAVARMEGKASLGETIDIVDHQGKWLARGAYSPASQIRARVWTFDPSESIDIAFFSRRLQQAQKWRDWLAQKDGLDSYRLIAGESDGLPGITIDRFGNFLVLQLLSAGAEYQRTALISALQTLYPECAIYDRSDVAVRKKEGMELTQGLVTGELPMTSDLFQKIIADAAIDAGRDVQFIEQFRQAADHPVIATYPEGLYLKGFACRVM
ncbi:23S rRNA methyltransferase [Shigella dysenteriae]|uniref:23S rRNA methyltransferase n=1 Tax=Shigella dysenteriae TaxID=622 RepID=UPI000E5C93BD|nr:23S rRNA methyltransferase [Shigella dysenteriae]RIH14000.1 23S rRNA methyltransferase [Shigella dysenteriae]